MLAIIIKVLLAVLLLYFFWSGAYFLIFALAGALSKRGVSSDEPQSALRKIAVLIPAYKEDAVIIKVAEHATKQDYDSAYYDVVIIADSLQAETLGKLKALPIKVVEVVFETSTKSKALRKAMSDIGDNYQIACVLDADNLMAKDFLSKVNAAFSEGYQIVQGHRTALNKNTPLAVLDAASEEVNNTIFRKGHRALGLSSALIGSGMAFEYSLFKSFMNTVEAIGGFDKELELKMLKAGKTIEYLNDALVFDEKVSTTKNFENQRRRWLSAQLVYFRRFFLSALVNLVTRANVDFFDKALQMILPPRPISLAFSALYFMATLLLYLFYDFSILGFLTSPWLGLALVAIVSAAILLAIPRKMYNKDLLKAVVALPGATLSMFKVLFKLRGANKKFIHTQHGGH